MDAIEELESHTVSVVRLMDSPTAEVLRFNSPEVMSTMTAGDPASLKEAARRLNEMDVAVIQHEFGIYGGEDGDEVITLMQRLRVPTIVVMHTVVTSPTDHQLKVLSILCDLASAIITMSVAARDRLVSKYSVNPAKVSVVPHGAPAMPFRESKSSMERPQILTWGLIGPGKGIEWAIEAMSLLQDISPAPQYIVAGRTHPKVLTREGEAYRNRLQLRIDELDFN
jgi:glycosyltransferase involved in cell wall biosynthesis